MLFKMNFLEIEKKIDHYKINLTKIDKSYYNLKHNTYTFITEILVLLKGKP